MGWEEIFITHIETKGPLLKICGQRDQQAAQFVEQQILDFTDDFDAGKIGMPSSPNELIPGLTCCARYSDSRDFRYYRARIIHLENLKLGLVSVYFIDYGNTENIHVRDIRLLDNQAVHILSSLDPLVSEFFLGYARPTSGQWEDVVINYVKDALMYSSRPCRVLMEKNGKNFIQVDYDKTDFTKHLIDVGYAAQVLLETQSIQADAEEDIRKVKFNAPPPPPTPVSANHQRPIYSLPSQPIPRSMITRPLQHSVPQGRQQIRVQGQPYAVAQEPVKRFSCDLIEENTEHAVYVSHVENGPQLFTIQLKNVAENQLVQMMRQLNSLTPIPKSAPILPGSFCLGRFTEDKTLCRAVVMLVMDDKCQVYYLDFGNSEVLPCSEIYELPQEFLSIKLMAYRFTLANIKSMELSPEVETLFKELVTKQELKMRVTPKEDIKTKQYCELFVKGRNIKDIIVEIIQKRRMAPVVYAKATLPARGSTVKVLVSHVEKVTKIFVQPYENLDMLNMLMAAIASHCKDASLTTFRPNQLKSGMPVCAFYSDGQWYRAQIITSNDVDAKVLFVDYGNEDTLPITSLRFISPDLVRNVQMQAIECCLAGYETSEPNEALDNQLYNLIIEKTMTMKVFGILIDDVLIVEFFDDDKKKISSFLLPTMLSSFSQPQELFRDHNPVALIQAAPPVIESNDLDEWKEDIQEEKPLRMPTLKSRIGSGRILPNNSAEKYESDYQYHTKSAHNAANYAKRPIKKTCYDSRDKNSFNSDNQRGGRFSDSRDDFNSQRGGKFEKFGEESYDNQRGGKYSKPRDDFSSQRGGRFDKSGEDDFDGHRGGGRFEKSGEETYDNQRGGKFNKPRDDFSSQRGGRFDKSGEDDFDGQRGSKFSKSRDDFSSQRGGRYDKSKEEDSSGDNWRQKRDKDNFDSGGSWRNKNDDNTEDGGRKSFRGDDRGSWRAKDSGENNSSGYDKSGGGFQSKSSWKSRDEGENSSWKSRDNFGEKRGNKWDRDDNKFGDSSRTESFKSQRYNSQDSTGFKGGKGGFGDKGSWKSDRQNSYFSQPTAPPKKLTVPIPSVKVGDREIVEIVYSLSPDDFYIQTTKQNSELTDLMAKIAEEYVSGGSVVTSVNDGDYCIAQYSEDEVWYRARVQSSLPGNITVLFIDYGNTEVVSSEKIKEITSDLCTLPAQAVRCCLLGVSSDSGAEWTEEKLTDFSLATEDKTLEAHFLSKNFSKDVFQICLRDKSNPDEEVIINHSFGATDDILNSVVPPTPGDAVKFSSFPVQLGSKLEVQVTWLVSPYKFYVQPLYCNADFREMMEHLQKNVKNFKLIGEYEQSVDKSVVTCFKEDKAIYRAIIKENGQVLFVDYGNSEQIDKSHTWSVEPEYSLMPCQAIECSLAGVKPLEGDSWPPPKTTNLESFFESDKYLCTFQTVSEDGKFVVKLEHGEVSVADQLTNNGLALIDETTAIQFEDPRLSGVQLSLLPGQLVRAKVISVKELGIIYVQLLPEQALATFEEIAAIIKAGNLTQLTTDGTPLGAICLVNTEGNDYQRGCVLDNSDEFLVFGLIDHGGSIKTTMDKVFELSDTIALVPGFAFECTFTPKKDAVIEEVKENLENKCILLEINSTEIPNRLTANVYDLNGNLVGDSTEGGKEKVDLICPLSIFQKLQTMIISHAEKDSIYLQRAEDQDSIIDLITRLYEKYEVAEAASDKAWEPGMFCAAKSVADDQWYRAKIANIEEDLVNVCYIDYGNSELISNDRINTLEESFLAENMYAVKVKLPVTWSVGEEILLELFPGESFVTHFSRHKDDWFVNMLNNEGVSIIEKLTELGFVIELEDSPFKTLVSGIAKLHEGDSFKAFRVHIVSPSQFWVVLSDDFEKVESLQDRLQHLADSMRPITRKSLPAQRSMIAAKFSDNIWYRALYDSAADTVFSVDYGNTEMCMEELKELPEELLEPTGYAIECALNIQPVTTPDWNTEVMARFDSLIPDDEITIKILRNNSSNILVDLIVMNDSISETMISKGLAAERSVTGYVSHINSASDFYIQEECNQLDQIRDSLVKAEEFTAIEDIESKKDCVFAAQFNTDGLWYRAKYLEGIDGGAKVLFVDYGNSDEAQLFRELPEQLTALPFSAKHCSLHLKDSDADWSEIMNATEKFMEISGDGSTLFEVKTISKGDPCIVDLILDAQSVSDTLLSSATQEGQDNDEELKLRTRAFVSHINSPSDFWVQFENSPLESVSSQLLEAGNWNIVSDIQENALVAALFEDDVWYRAQVISKTEDVVTVLFIDYGNSAPAIEIRELPEELKEIAPLAEHCRLKLPPGVLEWSQESQVQFSEVLENGALPVDINFLTSDDVPKTVELNVNDEDVAKQIAKFCESKQEVIGSSNVDGQQVVVCHINSPKDFYVHTDLEAVDEMATNLLGGSTFEVCETENLIGSVVAACFKDDEQWYRAKVISKAEDTNGFEVMFIDFGNTAIAEDFLNLSSALAQLPPLAKWCCLDRSKNWTPEATDKFRDLATDGLQKFDMKIVDEQTSPICVELILNGEQLHKILPSTDPDEESNRVTIPKNIDDVASADDSNQLEDKNVEIILNDEQSHKILPSTASDEEINKVTIPKNIDDVASVDDSNQLEDKNVELIFNDEQSHKIPSPTGSDEERNKVTILNNIDGVTFADDSKQPEDKNDELILNGEQSHKILPSTGSDEETNQVIVPINIDDVASADDSNQPENKTVEACEKGNKLDVTISHVNSPFDFYVCTDQEKSDEMSENLQEVSEFEVCEPSELIGSIVAANFVEDDLWYRARIIAKVSDEADDSPFEVLFIDYGNTAAAYEFRKLPNHLSKIEPLAKHCSLKVSKGLPLESTQKFTFIADNGLQQFEMEYLDENSSPCVVELFLGGKAVSDILQPDSKKIMEKLQEQEKSMHLPDEEIIFDEQEFEKQTEVSEVIETELKSVKTIKDSSESEVADSKVSSQDQENKSFVEVETKVTEIEKTDSCVEKPSSSDDIGKCDNPSSSEAEPTETISDTVKSLEVSSSQVENTNQSTEENESNNTPSVDMKIDFSNSQSTNDDSIQNGLSVDNKSANSEVYTKVPRSEKIVPGAVGLGIKLESETED